MTSPISLIRPLCLLVAFMLPPLGLLANAAEPGPTDSATKVVLSNGVRLIIKPEAETDVVALTLFVRTGRGRSPAEIAAAALVAHALLYGSVNHSFEGVALSVARMGGSLETVTAPDHVAITCVTTASRIREAIDLVCDALKDADFSPEALNRARREIIDEQSKSVTEPFTRARQILAAALQGTSEPDELSLRHVRQEQARAFFLSNYLPANTVFSVVGRLDVNLVRKEIDNNLSDYDRTAPPSLPAPPSEPRTGAFTLTTAGHVGYALVGVPAPDVSSPDYPVFLVLQMLLGEGHASRLFRRVRDRLGFGYDVGATYRADRSEPLIAYLEWSERRGHAAGIDGRSLIEAQMDAITSDPPTEAEMARARNIAIGQDALRHERVRERAFFLGWYEMSGAGFAFDEELAGRLASVTQADILRVAHNYLPKRADLVATPAR